MSKKKKKPVPRWPEAIEWQQVLQKRARYRHETGRSRMYTGPETSSQYHAEVKPAIKYSKPAKYLEEHPELKKYLKEVNRPSALSRMTRKKKPRKSR